MYWKSHFLKRTTETQRQQTKLVIQLNAKSSPAGSTFEDAGLMPASRRLLVRTGLILHPAAMCHRA